MTRHSIFTRLTFFFIFVLLAVVTGFYFLSLEIKKQNRTVLEKESHLMITLLRQSILLPEKQHKQFFKNRGYTYKPMTEANTQSLTPVFKTVPERFTPEIKTSIQEGRIQFMASDNMFYMLINRPDTPFMIGAKCSEVYGTWLWGGFLALLLLIISFFFSIIYSLLPLKHLTRAIKKYGDNDTYTPTKSNAKDEIAFVANAFDEAVRKNRALTEARRLFMRNVMHELKTPITVGKLSLPFLKRSQETEILERAFVRMELLIDDMARIEQITSQSAALVYEPCRLTKLTDEAAALMLIDEGSIVREFRAGDTILADCHMMISVFKNLIDNAFKYSTDKRVIIRRKNRALLFINQGEAWPETQRFETMLEPFTYNNTDTPAKSFGLGLYIVQSILEIHHIDFSYYYQDDKHHFALENIPLQPNIDD